MSVRASDFHVFRVQLFSFRTILLSSTCLSVHPTVFLLQLSNSLVVEPSVRRCIHHVPVCNTSSLEGRGGLSLRVHCSPYRWATAATQVLPFPVTSSIAVSVCRHFVSAGTSSDNCNAQNSDQRISFCDRARILIYILQNQLLALKYTLKTLLIKIN